MELRGHRVAEACGTLWHGTEGRIYMSLPYHRPLAPDPDEVARLLVKAHATGVRFPSLAWSGLPSGLYVCRDKRYDIHSPHRNFRAKVRRGLECCTVRRVEEAELLTQGLELNRETMRRQGRWDPEFGAPRPWRRFVEAMRRCPEIVPVGAFVGSRLAAFSITCREDGWLHLLHQMSRGTDLENCPNHALSFTLTCEAAKDPTLEAVSMGWVSLVDTEGLGEYKRRMGYETIPLNSAFQLHPALEPLLTSRVTLGLVSAARRLRPGDQRAARLAAVLTGARLSRLGRQQKGVS